MDAALKAIAEFGFVVAAAVALAWLVFWLIGKLLASKDAQIADAQKQRDDAMAGWRGSTAALEKLTEALRERNDLMERLVAGGR